MKNTIPLYFNILYITLINSKLNNSYFEFNDLSLNLIKNNTNHVVGVVQIASFEQIYLRYDQCKIPLFLSLCEKFGYDKEISYVFPCKNLFDKIFKNFVEMEHFLNDSVCCRLFVHFFFQYFISFFF